MSAVHGGYGLMLQLPERTVQQAVDAFVAANAELFRFEAYPIAVLDKYGIRQQFAIRAALVEPRITLLNDRDIQLAFGVASTAHIATRFDALPGGSEPSPAPDLEASIRGEFVIRVRAVYRRAGTQQYLALDLRYFSIVAVTLTVDSSTVILTDRTRTLLSAVARREIIYTLTSSVREIPASFEFKPNIPSFSLQSINLSFDYKVVVSGEYRALALLCEVAGFAVDWQRVSYALSQPDDVGLFLDLHVLNYALDLVERFVEGISLEKQEDPTNPKRHGAFTINDAAFHIESGRIVIDNLEIHIRVVDTIQREVRKVVCYLLGGACGIQTCDTILEYVMEDVLQLDQIGHIDGWVAPKVEDQHLTFESHLDPDVANWVWFVLPVLMGIILPGGMLITPILMIIGDMFLDRAVNNLVQEQSIDTLIAKEIPGSHLKVTAYAREVLWPEQSLAIMARVQFTPV